MYVTDVIGAGFVDFIYFAGGGHGQSTIRNAHGWGYGRFVSVEQAEDVMSFQNLRFIINAAGRVLGPRPGPGVCGPGASGAGTERCRGNFTVLPALVALNPGNVGLWLGRYVYTSVCLSASSVLVTADCTTPDAACIGSAAF